MDEIKRVYVLQQMEERKLSGREAAQRLGLSLRQVRRLLVKYRREGASGLAHGNRGRAPKNRVNGEVRKKIQELPVSMPTASGKLATHTETDASSIGMK